jgi:hypothetical protein
MKIQGFTPKWQKRNTSGMAVTNREQGNAQKEKRFIDVP